MAGQRGIHLRADVALPAGRRRVGGHQLGRRMADDDAHPCFGAAIGRQSVWQRAGQLSPTVRVAAQRQVDEHGIGRRADRAVRQPAGQLIWIGRIVPPGGRRLLRQPLQVVG